MNSLAAHPALPKINVMKEGKYWRVDWDYQEAPESRILFDKAEFLDGYISGLLDALGASAGSICCPSARVGTVKKVSEETARKLAELLKTLLHSHVATSHRRLIKDANLPHVRFLVEKQEVKATATN